MFGRVMRREKLEAVKTVMKINVKGKERKIKKEVVGYDLE